MPAQVLGDAAGFLACVAEDDRPFRFFEGEDAQELGFALTAGDRIVGVANLVHADEVGRELQRRRVMHETTGEALDAFRDRGGKEQRLSGLRRLAEDVLDVLLEAHGKHLIAFVEDGALDAVEVKGSAPDMIEDAAGRSADDLRTGLELFDLFAHRRAAVHRDYGQRRVRANACRLGRHLQRQLARRQQHQRLRVAFFGIGNPVGKGNREGRGLARARARLNQDVLALAGQGNGGTLDVHGLGKSHVGNSLEDGGANPEIGEACFGRVLRRRFARGLGRGRGRGSRFVHGAAPVGEPEVLRLWPICSTRLLMRSRRGASSLPKRRSSRE